MACDLKSEPVMQVENAACGLESAIMSGPSELEATIAKGPQPGPLRVSRPVGGIAMELL